MKSFAMALIAALPLAACAPREPQAARAPASRSINPAGTFDFSTVAQGMDVTGSIIIARGSSGYTGHINTGMTDPIPITGVSVEGQTMRITGQTPDGTLEMNLNFSGNNFTGSWTLGGQMSGSMTGKRRTG